MKNQNRKNNHSNVTEPRVQPATEYSAISKHDWLAYTMMASGALGVTGVALVAWGLYQTTVWITAAGAATFMLSTAGWVSIFLIMTGQILWITKGTLMQWWRRHHTA